MSRHRPPAAELNVDLGAIRDTLLYIESDLRSHSAYSEVLKPVREALEQLDNIERATGQIQKPNLNAVAFFPANF